jgi:thiol-disulfide isomerase/thioredoxin
MKKVIMFSAGWCGPCKATKPTFNALKEELKDVTMEVVDVNEQEALAKEYEIRAVPTFVLLNGEDEVARMSGGANADKLKAFINQ